MLKRLHNAVTLGVNQVSANFVTEEARSSTALKLYIETSVTLSVMMFINYLS